MAMRVLYLSKDGRCKVEKVKQTTGMIEMPDGYHPITNDSVWQDAKRKSLSLLIIVEGVNGPYGASMEEKDISRVLFGQEVREQAMKRPKVSKMWFRALERILEAIVKYGFIILIMGLVAFMVIQAVYQGVA